MLAAIIESDETLDKLEDISDSIRQYLTRRMYADEVLYTVVDHMDEDVNVVNMLQTLPEGDSLTLDEFSNHARKILDHMHAWTPETYSVTAILVVYGMVVTDCYGVSLPYYLDVLDNVSETSSDTSSDTSEDFD